MLSSQMQTARSISGRADRRREVLTLMVFVLVLLFANPFLFGDKGSGRYLLGVLQDLDGELFQHDPLVESIAHFGSLFYEVIGPLLNVLGVVPETLEPAFLVLYWLSRLALVAALWALARGLDHGLEMPLLLLAWASTAHATFVGSTAFFVPTLTHQQIAWILLLLALALLLRTPLSAPRGALLGSLIGLAILVHPLVAAYFLLIMTPAVFALRKRLDPWTAWLIPLAIVGLCGVLYLLTLAPPSLTAEEAALFVANKATSAHVSLFHQPSFAWLKLILLLALAGASVAVFSFDRPSARLLLVATFSGSLIAIVLAGIATTTEASWLIRLQPLRMFAWTQLLAQLTILQATAIAWRRRADPWPLLAATLAFMLVDSIWFIAWMGLACAALLAEGFGALDVTRRRFWIRNLAAGLLALIVLLFALGERQPLASARAATGVWIAVVVGWVLLDKTTSRRPWQAFLLIALAVTLSSWQTRRDVAEASDPAWTRTTRWIRQHTDKSARFLTASGLPNFRFAAWRTSDTEALSALYWVDPATLQPVLERERRVDACKGEAGCLFALARELGSDHLLLDRPLVDPESADEAIFEDAPYRVYRVEKGQKP